MPNIEKKLSLPNGLEYFLLCLVAVIGLTGSIYMFASNAQKNANNNFNQFATAPGTMRAQNIAAAVTTNKTSVMGMEFQPLNQAIISSLNNPLTEGVFVSAVNQNTPASRAGIKAGDIIFKLDGRWITSPEQLKRRLNTYVNNDNVRLGIYRDGQRVNRYLVISQNLVQQNGNNTLQQQTNLDGLPTETNWNGMELKPITTEALKNFMQ